MENAFAAEGMKKWMKFERNQAGEVIQLRMVGIEGVVRTKNQ